MLSPMVSVEFYSGIREGEGRSLQANQEKGSGEKNDKMRLKAQEGGGGKAHKNCLARCLQ